MTSALVTLWQQGKEATHWILAHLDSLVKHKPVIQYNWTAYLKAAFAIAWKLQYTPTHPSPRQETLVESVLFTSNTKNIVANS